MNTNYEVSVQCVSLICVVITFKRQASIVRTLHPVLFAVFQYILNCLDDLLTPSQISLLVNGERYQQRLLDLAHTFDQLKCSNN